MWRRRLFPLLTPAGGEEAELDELDHDEDDDALVAGNWSATIGLAVVAAVLGLLWLVIIARIFLDGRNSSTSESISDDGGVRDRTVDGAERVQRHLSRHRTSPARLRPRCPLTRRHRSRWLADRNSGVESTVASTFPPRHPREESAGTQGVAAAVSDSTMDVIASDASSSEPASTQPANTLTSSTSLLTTTTVPETTAPETTAPETTAPETTAPETTARETTELETTVSETTAPETTELETTELETTVSDTIVPETTVLETTGAGDD